MAPKVSVVIDNYNYGRYLGRAIRSVQEQDYSGEVECLVVDDGSTDDSREVIASFGSGVRGVLQRNLGQASAFNNGFAAARGEFVCLLDSDDYWAADKLRKVVARFEDPGIGAVQHFLQDVDAGGAPLKRRFPSWPAEYGLDDFLEGRAQFTATSGVVFRKSVLDRIVPIPRDIFYYLDDLLLVRALCLSRAANVPEVLGFHRIHDANYCFGGYWNPKKLELDFRMRELFNGETQAWIARAGKSRTQRHKLQEELEYFRRRILHLMFQGERARAAGLWWSLLVKHGGRRFGFFRALSCLPLLISVRFYLWLYEFYEGSDWMIWARRRFFPD